MVCDSGVILTRSMLQTSLMMSATESNVWLMRGARSSNDGEIENVPAI
jgi:hypothetical protein